MARAAGSLSELLEVGQTLSSASSLRSAFSRVLEILREGRRIRSGTIALRDEASGEIVVEGAAGLDLQKALGARYAVGEGITGRVVQSGRPVVVPRVSREPLFLNRTGTFRATRKEAELSYLCVPIRADGRTIGALGVALPFEKERVFDDEAKLLAVVASMVGQAVRVRRLVEAAERRLGEENAMLRSELRERYALDNVVGTSHAMAQVYEQVAQVKNGTTTVLLRGESGTGKELIAHAIHYGSPRAGKPFVKVSCGALPEGLVESELFGYEAGAFTDARAPKKGRFELAHGGTLFLDEVGELTLATQVKLLRVLQEREIERLGGVKTIKLDVRLVTATNKDLEAAVRAGTFREDLYYRLNVFSIFLPPLRERRADVLLLADHFVERYAKAQGKEVRRIATSAIDMLTSYHWPGNVRELENCIERAVLVCEGAVLHAHHLPPTLQTAEVSGTVPRISLERAVQAYERDLLVDALKSARGNRAKAARLLASTERIVGYKVKIHRIDPARFRS